MNFDAAGALSSGGIRQCGHKDRLQGIGRVVLLLGLLSLFHPPLCQEINISLFKMDCLLQRECYVVLTLRSHSSAAVKYSEAPTCVVLVLDLVLARVALGQSAVFWLKLDARYRETITCCFTSETRCTMRQDVFLTVCLVRLNPPFFRCATLL